MLTRAPFFDNVYVSPRTRHSQQGTVQSEEVKTIEGGYIKNAPRLKIRITGYYTEIDNQMEVMT